RGPQPPRQSVHHGCNLTLEMNTLSQFGLMGRPCRQRPEGEAAPTITSARAELNALRRRPGAITRRGLVGRALSTLLPDHGPVNRKRRDGMETIRRRPLRANRATNANRDPLFDGDGVSPPRCARASRHWCAAVDHIAHDGTTRIPI